MESNELAGLEHPTEKFKEIADKESLEEKIKFCNDYRENLYELHRKMMATIDYREKIRLQVLQNNEAKGTIDFIVETIPKYLEKDHDFYTSLFREVVTSFAMIESSVEARIKVLDTLIPQLEKRCDDTDVRLKHLEQEIRQIKREAGIPVAKDEEKKRQRNKLMNIVKRKVAGAVMSFIGFISMYSILSMPPSTENVVPIVAGGLLFIGGLDYLLTSGKRKRYGRKSRRRKG